MSYISRLATGFFILALLLGAATCTFRETIAMRLMEQVVTRNLQSTLLDELPDGLHVALCGAGSPLPDAERSGPCVAVIAGGKLYIVDSGSGASRVLARSRLPQGRIEAVFLTHFHSDHIDGLGELMLQRWVGGANHQPLPVYGPPGVERVVAGFNEAYAHDFAYRVAHHGEQTVPRSGAGARANPFALPADTDTVSVLLSGELEVRAFLVDHAPVKPAVGYRFDYEGRSTVISGDTQKSANLQRIADGVDLLVHEALSAELVALMNRSAKAAGVANVEKITADIPDYHTTPVEAAEIARDAKVGRLLFYHIVPPLPLSPLRSVFLEGVDDIYDGPFSIAIDGTLIEMPVGSNDSEEKEIL